MRLLFEKNKKIITLQMKLYTTGGYMNNGILFEKNMMKSFFNKAKLNHNKSLSVNSKPQCNKICLILDEIE